MPLITFLLAEIGALIIEKVGETAAHAVPVALAEIGTKSVYKKAIEKLKLFKQKDLPENGDLLKALRIAMLDALLFTADAAFKEMKEDAVASPFITGNKVDIFKEQFNLWIVSEKKLAGKKANEELIGSSSFTEVERMISNPKNEDIAILRNTLSKNCKKEILSELKTAFGANFPHLIEEYILNGWGDPIKKDWFDCTCFLFGQLLKKPEFEKSKIAFQNDLLSKIAIDIGMLDSKFDNVIGLLEKQISYGDYIIEKLKQLDRIEEGVDRIEIGIVRLDDDVVELKNRLINIEKILIEDVNTLVQIKNLKKERDNLKIELAKRDEIIEKQEQTKKELEKELNAEKDKDTLKEEALEAIKHNDYDKADELLKQATSERIEKVADDFYQIGLVKELKFEYVESLKYFELAAKIPPHNPKYLNKAALLSMDFGNLQNTINYLNDAVELYYQTSKEEKEELGAYYNNLGLAWQYKGELSKAIGYMEKALKIVLKIYGEESSQVAIHYSNLGLAWMDKGELDKAISYMEKALEMGLKIYGEESPQVAIRYSNLGLAWQDKGELEKAIEYMEKALKIGLKIYGEESPQVGIYYNNLGVAWRDKGELEKAIEYMEKALKIQLKIYGEESPRVAIDYNNLGVAWRDKGELEKAIEYMEKALKIQLKIYGEESPQVAIDYNNLGLAWRDKGELEKAIEYMEKALKIQLKIYGEESPQVAIHYNNLGLALQDKGELDKAIDYLNRSNKIFLKVYGPDNPSTINVKENLEAIKRM